MTPNQARNKARDWGFTDDDISRMLADATVEPSYWSRNVATAGE